MAAWLRILPVLISAAAALAQAQAQPADSLGSVAGVVRSAVTRAPLEGVSVNIGSAGSVATDAMGRFAFPAVPPGRLWVSANDSRRAASGGVYVLVNSGQETGGVEILLKVGGGISGKVVDETWEPVVGASILLLERRFELGELVYSPRLTVSTGKNGEYRLEPVPAEHGFLILARNPLAAPAAADEIDPDPLKRPRIAVSTYYPGSRSGLGAETVTLTSGEIRQDVNIRMGSAPPYCIAGTLEAPEGTGISTVGVKEVLSLPMGARFKPATAKLSAGGRFRACGLPPGDYQLSAADPQSQRSQRMYAFAPVSIVDRDVGDVRMQANSAAPIPGEIAWDPAPRTKPADPRIGVMLRRDFAGEGFADEPKPPSSVYGATSMGERVEVPGAFTLAGIPPDSYILELGRLPAGCYIKEATYGGVDVRNALLRLTGLSGRLKLVLGCDGGSLTARVRDREGNPVSRAHLCLMPTDAVSEATFSKDTHCAEVDNGWSAISQPMAPGKYLAIASEATFDGSAEPLIKLWFARSRAKEVEIGANGTTQVILELAEVN